MSPENFWEITDKWGHLRRLHLLEPTAVGATQYPLMGEGDTVVEKPKYDNEGHVWINETQYFDQVPEVAWNFYVGGYQPAQKWLADRKGRQLSFEDILHYQRILKVLLETDRTMKSIDLAT